MISILSFFGCALLKPLPKPKGTQERLSDFPTEGLPLRENVTVYWDDHLIPFIEAQNDDDLAVPSGWCTRTFASPRWSFTGGPLREGSRKCSGRISRKSTTPSGFWDCTDRPRPWKKHFPRLPESGSKAMCRASTPSSTGPNPVPMKRQSWGSKKNPGGLSTFWP